jgi:hypothetical protein
MAQVLARIFPAQKAFVESEMKFLDRASSSIKFGPYPTDELLVRNDRFVEFRTPAHAEGLGTMDRLKANDDPIDGVAIFKRPEARRLPTLLILRVRLPKEQRDLAPVIIHDLLVREGGDAR